ncbi:MAG: hypothetical protein QNJ98_16535 [Planctomycetota bacterium]|nr:hypothetical protein [Planctomycetota bacterium]
MLICLLAFQGEARAKESHGLADARKTLRAAMQEPLTGRWAAAEKVLHQLAPLAKANPALAEAIHVFRAHLDRSRLLDDGFGPRMQAFREASTAAARKQALHALTERALEGVATALRTTDPKQLTSKEVEQLIQTLGTASAMANAYEGNATPSAGTRAAGHVKIAKALFDLAAGLATDDRRRVREAAAAVLTTRAPTPAADPAGLSAKLIGETARVTERAAEVIDDAATAIASGRDEDVETLVRRAERFEADVLGGAWTGVFERYVRDKVKPLLPVIGSLFGPLTDSPGFGGQTVSSNDPAKRIVALVPRPRLMIWHNESGGEARMVFFETQPVIHVTRGYVQIDVWSKIHNWEAGAPPTASQLGYLTRGASGQTVHDVEITFADGTRRRIRESTSSSDWTFRPGPKVIRTLVVNHAFAGKTWSESFDVRGY